MPTEQKQENLRIHTIGLTEEEANASLDEHGEIDQCSLRGCSGSSVIMLIVKKPGSGWGENISSLAGCSVHLPRIEAMILKMSIPIHTDLIGEA